MTPTRVGAITAAGLGLATAVLNVFQLSSVTHLTADAVAGVNVALASGAAFIGAIFISPPAKKP